MTHESATDELRRLLDERGVEWSSPSGLNSSFADSITFIGNVAVVSEIDENDLLRINFDGTPEQAVDAILGRGTCHIVMISPGWWECDECANNIDWDSCDPNDPPSCNFCPSCGREVVDE